MYYALKYVSTWGTNSAVRAVRVKPFKTLDAARKAVERAGKGYVKKLNNAIPVWSNIL